MVFPEAFNTGEARYILIIFSNANNLSNCCRRIKDPEEKCITCYRTVHLIHMKPDFVSRHPTVNNVIRFVLLCSTDFFLEHAVFSL